MRQNFHHSSVFYVFFPFILDIMFVGRTSRGHTGGRSHRRKVTQEFSSTFFLWCVPSFFSREGFSHSFPLSTMKSNFVFTRWAFLFVFICFVFCEKIRLPGSNSRPNVSEGYKVASELPGRPALSSEFHKKNLCPLYATAFIVTITRL